MPNTRDGFKLLPSSIGVPRGEDGGRGHHAFRPQHGLPHQGAQQSMAQDFNLLNIFSTQKGTVDGKGK